MQLRCNTQCQSHRAYRRRCFIYAGGQWEILICADKNASTKEQRKVHRQNGRGGFDGTAIDSAPKELGAVPLPEGRGSISSSAPSRMTPAKPNIYIHVLHWCTTHSNCDLKNPPRMLSSICASCCTLSLDTRAGVS